MKHEVDDVRRRRGILAPTDRKLIETYWKTNMPEKQEYPDSLDRSQLKRKLNEAANSAAGPMGAGEVAGSSANSTGDQLDTMVDVNCSAAGDVLTRLSDICRTAAARLSETGTHLPAGDGDHPSAGLVAIARLLCDNIEPQRRPTGSLSIFRNGRRYRVHH